MENKTEIQFQIIKAMLDEFPELKQKVREYFGEVLVSAY